MRHVLMKAAGHSKTFGLLSYFFYSCGHFKDSFSCISLYFCFIVDNRVKHTYILDDPFDDPPQLAELIPQASPEGKPPDEIDDVRLEDDWVPLDETMDPAQLEESMREKEAHSHAVVLEMIGDIPDAEIKPPENVLFVCKLNTVTQVSTKLVHSKFCASDVQQVCVAFSENRNC
ncbi:peptidyl-prolyl cis-trans isomerase CYP59-like [Nymphaea colorata]|nr:peptidyl-prolyl cis-trans isomerase CYP59-like [Nymphaea colorata]